MPQTQNGRPGAGAAGKQVGQTNRSVPLTDMPRQVTGWCPPGGCTARQTAELELAVKLAFANGRAYERAELAEMEATWRPLIRPTYEQRVAERLAAMPGSNPPPALRFDDAEWPPVAVPGGGGVRLGVGQIVDGRVDYLQHISEPTPCSCVRRPDGRHRVPDDELTSHASQKSAPSHVGSGVAA